MSALVIYGLITIVCGGLLFVMAIFGADSDVDMDADVDIDMDVDADVDVDGLEMGGPSLLSLKLILIFLIGFGLCGFVSAQLKTQVHHVIIGLIGGGALWFVSYQALSWLYRQQSTSQVTAESFVGREGRVTVPIPAGGSGEVYCSIKGTGKSMYLTAQGEDSEKEYAKGDTVTIKSVDGSVAVVE
jgi:membrane protein implicated in regulation of membrane protease activity